MNEIIPWVALGAAVLSALMQIILIRLERNAWGETSAKWEEMSHSWRRMYEDECDRRR